MKVNRFAILLLSFSLSLVVSGQSRNTGGVRLVRRNPDRWFTILIPKNIGTIQRHADVEGGFYSSPELEIDFYYWTNANAPNFLRNARNEIAYQDPLKCSQSDLGARIVRKTMGGHRIILQDCFKSKNHYIHSARFLRLRVFDGKHFRNGVFNLTVSYSDPSMKSVAQRIVGSVIFRNSK